jgi:hypothetical protein
MGMQTPDGIGDKCPVSTRNFAVLKEDDNKKNIFKLDKGAFFARCNKAIYSSIALIINKISSIEIDTAEFSVTCY